jgi:hypothetical protein
MVNTLKLFARWIILRQILRLSVKLFQSEPQKAGDGLLGLLQLKI